MGNIWTIQSLESRIARLEAEQNCIGDASTVYNLEMEIHRGSRLVPQLIPTSNISGIQMFNIFATLLLRSIFLFKDGE